ncbi:MAG: hypothetical protein MHM6MM_001476 [Cercozoa sp. M6MM]
MPRTSRKRITQQSSDDEVREALDSMTRDEMRLACQARELKRSGTKADMKERLAAYLANSTQDMHDDLSDESENEEEEEKPRIERIAGYTASQQKLLLDLPDNTTRPLQVFSFRNVREHGQRRLPMQGVPQEQWPSAVRCFESCEDDNKWSSGMMTLPPGGVKELQVANPCEVFFVLRAPGDTELELVVYSHDYALDAKLRETLATEDVSADDSRFSSKRTVFLVPRGSHIHLPVGTEYSLRNRHSSESIEMLFILSHQERSDALFNVQLLDRSRRLQAGDKERLRQASQQSARD